MYVRKSDETGATAAALLSSRATKAEAAAIQRTMLNGWRLSRREAEAWWRKRRLGENFSFSFPISTSASHSRDIEPWVVLGKLLFIFGS